jgi:hypothetical protein
VRARIRPLPVRAPPTTTIQPVRLRGARMGSIPTQRTVAAPVVITVE